MHIIGSIRELEKKKLSSGIRLRNQRSKLVLIELDAYHQAKSGCPETSRNDIAFLFPVCEECLDVFFLT
uniref:TPM domain-containing protein n=1 Tax=Parascaris univalens TaxID=6257 RepID=A0A914ZVL3_PARUN